MRRVAKTTRPGMAAGSGRRDSGEQARLGGFDGLRAIAALSVFVYHLIYFAPVADRSVQQLLEQLRAGVWIFFVLSGFLLYRPYARSRAEGRSSPSLRSYAARRVLRILPAYWAALCFLTYVVHATVIAERGPRDALIQFGFLQIYTLEHTFLGLAHTWSLAVEAVFYALLPMYAASIGVLPGRRILGRELVGVAVLVTVGLVWTVATQGDDIKQQWLPNFLMAFGAGILLAVVENHRTAMPRVIAFVERLGRHPATCFGVAAIALLVRSRIDIPGENTLTSQAFYLFAAVALVLPFVFPANQGGITHSLMRNRIVVFLGRISYGIFLWHYLLIRIVRDDWFGWSADDAKTLVVGALALMLTLVAATVSWYAIERPALSLAGRFRR